MRTPGFGAEQALYRSSQRYTLDMGMFLQQPHSGAVTMAIPIDGGSPRRQCLEDCIDTCVDAGNSTQACRTRCGRLCTGGPGVGTSPEPNPTNRAVCVGGCWAWWVACLAETSLLGFGGGFCNYIRDEHCLTGCP
jgi:hypothetical protein